MQSFFLVDSYIRSYEREIVLKSIIEAGIPLTLCGDGWNRYLTEFFSSSSTCIFNHTSVHPSVTFADSFALMMNSKITLNIMPHFLNGAHDRIYSSMLNGSLCVTNTTPFLRNQFEDGIDYLCYDIKDLSSLPSILSNMLSNDTLRDEIAENGYKKVLAEHTWACRCKDLIHILNL